MSLFGAGFTVGGGNSKPRRNTTSAPPVVAPIRPSMNDLRVPGTNVRLRKGRRPGQPVNPNTERMYSGLDPSKSNRAARDAYNSELEAIMAEFDEAMRSAGGGGGGYGRAIQKAKEQLQDIQANRDAIKK